MNKNIEEGKMQQKVLAKSFMVILLIFNFLHSIPSYNEYPPSGFPVPTSRGKTVQDSFVSIQEAINQAANGSTVQVPSGTYYERIVINKTIFLIGEDPANTIIDGSNLGTIVTITEDDVTIAGFTIQNSGWGWHRNGIYVHHAGNCTIENNFLINNCQNIRLNYSWNSRVSENVVDGSGYGIRLINSISCTATGNNVSNCIGGVHLQNATLCIVERNYFTQNDQGIRMYSPCTRNMIFENIVYNNTYDGMIDAMPGNTTFFNNQIFHNNFIENRNPFIYKDTISGNIWDDGYPSGGNYWSQYGGLDLFSGPYQNETGRDGIGDAPYPINRYEVDRYPLMHPYGSVHNINTNLNYLTIQSAIDAPETLDGHTLQVRSGIYYENVKINKSLSILGENRLTTIVDGKNTEKVLSIYVDNVTFAGFTVRNSGFNYPPYGDDCGVYLDHTAGCNISDCLVKDNRIGIYVYFSNTNVIQQNRVESNLRNGIWLWYSGNNMLEGNQILNNSYNFGVSGGSFSHFNNHVDGSNRVNGKPIHYRIGVEDEIIDNNTDIGVLYLINSFNITVQNLDLLNNRHGLFGYNLTESTIQDLNASENSYGIYLQDSSENVVQNNTCLKTWVGIQLYNSNNNTVRNNVAGDSEKGISLYEADNNHISENEISSCLYGMRFYSSNKNVIFHNNLIDNTNQADLIVSHQNTWDNGFEGNYWSDYSGSDNDREGIGDTPHFVANNNSTDQDHYPLMGEFHILRVHYQETLQWVSIVTNSTIVSFDFEAVNNTIKLEVNGTDGTYGFCRVSIPHVMVNPEIVVIIDDGLTETLYPNYSIRDDGARRWIYFAYQHSTHDILIISEFRTMILLSISMILLLWISILRRITED